MAGTLKVDEIYSSTGNISIPPGHGLDLSDSQSSLNLPKGTTAQEVTPPASGLRFDTDIGEFKSYGQSWNRFKNKQTLKDYEKRIKTGEVLYYDLSTVDSYPNGNRVYDLSKAVVPPANFVGGVDYETLGGGSLKFNYPSFGNERIEVTSDVYNINKDLTLNAWVYPYSYTANGGNGGFIISNICYYMEIDTAGRISSYFYNTSSPGYHDGNQVIPLDTWSQITTVRDHSDNTIKMYYNGQLDRIVSGITGDTLVRSPTAPVRIGSYTSGYSFQGNIAIASIHNRALSQEELLYTFELYKDRFGIS